MHVNIIHSAICRGNSEKKKTVHCIWMYMALEGHILYLVKAQDAKYYSGYSLLDHLFPILSLPFSILWEECGSPEISQIHFPFSNVKQYFVFRNCHPFSQFYFPPMMKNILYPIKYIFPTRHSYAPDWLLFLAVFWGYKLSHSLQLKQFLTLHISALKMNAASFFETSVSTCKTTLCHNL
jgi:hypothetical protein